MFKSLFDSMKKCKDADTLKCPVILVRFEYTVENKNVLREESTRVITGVGDIPSDSRKKKRCQHFQYKSP